MKKRTAYTKTVRINSLSYGSLFEIGDAAKFTPTTEVIAIQKEGGFQSDEGIELSDFPIFYLEPKEFSNSMTVQQTSNHHSPSIHVNSINITGVSSSSSVQIGSLSHIDALARIKHIRILKDEQNNES